jgi:hypothetical protein
MPKKSLFDKTFSYTHKFYWNQEKYTENDLLFYIYVSIFHFFFFF